MFCMTDGDPWSVKQTPVFLFLTITDLRSVTAEDVLTVAYMTRNISGNIMSILDSGSEDKPSPFRKVKSKQ